ncbi:MAG: glycerol-3-phosphate 1-O-acyltransferase PlsY [Gammaproteobacteria bacterium]|nr:glycerol-3-phosphate 1-O-acyltransferase PlsY [Gammaproteobacteria bacterium]
METAPSIIILFIILAYLLGSFSSAITLSKLLGFPDPRAEGSHNPGATNVLRIAGKKAAALTLFGDMLKGFVPVLLANLVIDNPLWIAATGFSAFLGHCYPIYYQLKGGKGVATAIGFILAFNWITGLAVVSIWLVVAQLFKLSSLAALIAFLIMPLINHLLMPQLSVTLILTSLSIILFWRHQENIKRLLQGSEKTSKLDRDDNV